MSEITVRMVPKPEDRSLPVFSEMERLSREIEKRARELFESHGFAEGHALDDWLQAEHEICWPAAELTEHGEQIVLSIALPGYETSEIDVTATPREVIGHGARKAEKAGEGQQSCVHWSEFRSNDVYRRFEMPVAIDADNAKATYRHGMLKVTVPKAAPVVKEVAIADAA